MTIGMHVLRWPCPLPAFGANNRAYDFVFDTCANGQSLKWLTAIDEFTREARRGWQHPFGPRHRGPGSADQRTWRTVLLALRQRPGVHQQAI